MQLFINGALMFLFTLCTSQAEDIITVMDQLAVGQESTRYLSWSCQE